MRNKCDVENCNHFANNGGVHWSNTGYWNLCDLHLKPMCKKQPKMKPTAIDR